MNQRLMGLAVISAFLLAWSGLARRNTATVFGTVTDSSGGVVSGVNVKIANDATGQEWATVSNRLGNSFCPICHRVNIRSPRPSRASSRSCGRT